MQIVEIDPKPMRRWCYACGMSRPADQTECLHCGAGPRETSFARPRSASVNSGKMVQHFHVDTIENLAVNNDLREISQTLEDLQRVEVAQARPSFFQRFFQFTCVVALWTGILTVSSIMAFFIWLVYQAYVKVHGG